MTTLNASLPDKRFVAFRLKSNAGCECDYNGLWRLLPSLTYECRPPTDWKLCAETGRASTASASTTSDGVCFIWTGRGAMEIEVIDYH